MDMANDWRDELRNPLAAVLFGLMLLAGAGMLAVIYADNTGRIDSATGSLWTWRMFALACVFPLTYAIVRAGQMARRNGFSALWKDDDDAKE